MSGNLFGSFFQCMTFGESHGNALGVIVDGCPSNVPISIESIQKELNRRMPGGELVSARKEADQLEVLSGIFEGRTLGTPIAMIVHNKDGRAQDYEKIKDNPRQGHADDVWKEKFKHVDYRGGGRSSGRETVSRVMAGALAKQVFAHFHPKTNITCFLGKIGEMVLSEGEIEKAFVSDQEYIESFSTRFPSERKNEELEQYLLNGKKAGESFGAEGVLIAKEPPKSLGEPVFKKLKAELASALMSIGAIYSVELGWIDDHVANRGTQFHGGNERVYGGVRGGLSTGEDIVLKFKIKPTSSILDVAKSGRHDPCIGIRALPVVESMVWLTLMDMALAKRSL